MRQIIDFRQQPAGWKTGIYDLDNYEQYAAIAALRSSDLKKMNKSPLHYRAAILNEKPITPQLEKSFAKGKAFDVLILHGRMDFEALITIEPDLNRNTKEYKAWKAAAAGAECILTIEEKSNIIAMQQAANAKSQFAKIFGGAGFRHRVIIWQDSRTGLWCKAEIDFITDNGIVVDLKTTADAGFFFFSRNAAKLGYYNQGAFYLDGLTQVTGIAHNQFYLAAVEVEPPFESHIFKASQEQILRSQYQNEENMGKLLECLETGQWPGYPDHIMDLESGHYIYDDFKEEKGETINGF